MNEIEPEIIVAELIRQTKSERLVWTRENDWKLWTEIGDMGLRIERSRGPEEIDGVETFYTKLAIFESCRIDLFFSLRVSGEEAEALWREALPRSFFMNGDSSLSGMKNRLWCILTSGHSKEGEEVVSILEPLLEW